MLVAGVFFVVGLSLLDVLPLGWSTPDSTRFRGRGLLAALALGLIFGIALGPCTFAYMAPMLGVTFRVSGTDALYGVLLIAAYGIGHCSIIVLAGASTELGGPLPAVDGRVARRGVLEVRLGLAGAGGRSVSDLHGVDPPPGPAVEEGRVGREETVRVDPAGPPEWFAEATALRAMAPRGVLFLCVANSARSQLAEGIARSLAPAGVTVWSAGSQPTLVRPEAIAALAEIGIDISHHRAKAVSEIPVAEVDAVITLCGEEECPVFLGKARRLHWGLPDPAGVIGSDQDRADAFRKTRDELRRRLAVVFADEGRDNVPS